MRILLDTCMVLWWMNDSSELTPSEREEISDPENDIYVSAASAWEVEIKRKLGKLDLPDEWKDAVSATGFRWLSVLPRHTEGLRMLPDIHRDPFDRMIVAQAKSEKMTVRPDARLQGAGVLWITKTGMRGELVSCELNVMRAMGSHRSRTPPCLSVL